MALDVSRAAGAADTETRLAAQAKDASDDEILGLVPNRGKRTRSGRSTAARGGSGEDAAISQVRPADSDSSESSDPLEDGADDRPEKSGDSTADAEAKDVEAYREMFKTPEEARAAAALLADLNRMDALFFSQRPEDHLQLARSVAALDAAAFSSLVKAMQQIASEAGAKAVQSEAATSGAEDSAKPPASAVSHAVTNRNAAEQSTTDQSARRDLAGFTPEQATFFHATNAAAVENILQAIEAQVNRLLPEGTSKSARTRVVGEVYRELDGTLRANRQLTQQIREAFRSGKLDAQHQQSIVSLISARARQSLPAVSKRVLDEWTSTLVSANQERRNRQRTAERRVDIAGSGATGAGRRSMSPREIDYSRMSDSDILNL
jgi:hypothetical protein